MDDMVSTIAHAHQIAKDAVEAELGASDVTPSQARYLLALAKDEGVSQTLLTEATKIDRSTLADVSRRLLKKDLIHRRKTRDDARRYSVTLTTLGWERVSEIKAARRRIETRIRKAVGGVENLVIIEQAEAAE